MKALCHCGDCQKISGSAFSTNVVVPGDDFKVTGSPKKFTKTADSGKVIHSYFCGECGSTLYRDGDAFPGMKIIKAGVLDGDKTLEESKPAAELFAPQRASWQPEMPGAQQIKTME